MRFTGPISVLFSGVAIFIQVQAFAVQSVNLAWDASSDKNILGYAVYYGTASRQYTNVVVVGNVTSTTVSGLPENATCYFAVTARDALGLESEFSNEVSWFAPTALEPTVARVTFQTNGFGKISPDLTARDLTLGKSYTVAAIPVSGHVFAGWAGGSTSEVARLTFVMTKGLVLKAWFIPSPFIPIAGSYTGLFYEDDAVRQDRAGLFSISVTTYGTYSGRLQIGGERYSFSGRLGVDCQGTSVIPRNGSNALTLQFHLGSGAQADQVFGEVSGGAWTSPLQGDRAVFNVLTNPAPFAGLYNLILPGQAGDESLPGGDGHGSLRINTAGRVTFSGMLADNSRISQTVQVSKNGHWPMYVPLYRGGGSILSWLTFEDRAKDDIHGLLSWIKGADPTALFYPGGFTNVMNAVGSGYVPPVGDTNSLVSFTNGCLRFCGGELAASFTNAFTLGLKDKVADLCTNKLAMTFSRSNGRFAGRVNNPRTGLSQVFRGAVLQKANIGCGYLLGTNQSSEVILAP
jgi:hypothetical protein